jgi:hypothetical protein
VHLGAPGKKENKKSIYIDLNLLVSGIYN